jgi:hypothetical protein
MGLERRRIRSEPLSARRGVSGGRPARADDARRPSFCPRRGGCAERAGAAGRAEDEVKVLAAALRPQPAPPDLLRRLPRASAVGATTPQLMLEGPVPEVGSAPEPQIQARPEPIRPAKVDPISETQHLLRVTLLAGGRAHPQRRCALRRHPATVSDSVIHAAAVAEDTSDASVGCWFRRTVSVAVTVTVSVSESVLRPATDAPSPPTPATSPSPPRPAPPPHAPWSRAAKA